jgi:hypothetical protein
MCVREREAAVFLSPNKHLLVVWQRTVLLLACQKLNGTHGWKSTRGKLREKLQSARLITRGAPPDRLFIPISRSGAEGASEASQLTVQWPAT